MDRALNDLYLDPLIHMDKVAVSLVKLDHSHFDLLIFLNISPLITQPEKRECIYTGDIDNKIDEIYSFPRVETNNEPIILCMGRILWRKNQLCLGSYS